MKKILSKNPLTRLPSRIAERHAEGVSLRSQHNWKARDWKDSILHNSISVDWRTTARKVSDDGSFSTRPKREGWRESIFSTYEFWLSVLKRDRDVCLSKREWELHCEHCIAVRRHFMLVQYYDRHDSGKRWHHTVPWHKSTSHKHIQMWQVHESVTQQKFSSTEGNSRRLSIMYMGFLRNTLWAYTKSPPNPRALVTSYPSLR